MNIIFDFDGTICDSFDVAVDIIKTKFPKYFDRAGVTPQQARDLGVKKLLKITKFPKHKLPQLMFSSIRDIAEKIPELKTFPEIKRVVAKLSKKHILGIVTSNSQENVEKFLKNNNLAGYYSFISSKSSLFGKHNKLKEVIKKYNLDPTQTIYIGDETRDVEAARKVRIKSVAVTWGFESENVLRKSKPGYIVTKPKQLLNIFA
jgi:phosphoglycolate phosphatase